MSLEQPESEICVNGTRHSSESDRLSSSPSPTKGLNGSATTTHDGADVNPEDLSSMDPIQRLQLELQRTKEEKDALAGQYRNLLSKLTAMRTTLGNKLKQDAVRSPLYGLQHRVTPAAA